MKAMLCRVFSLTVCLFLCISMISCENSLVGEMMDSTSAEGDSVEESAGSGTQVLPEGVVAPLVLITAKDLYKNAKDQSNEDRSNMILDAVLGADAKYVALLGADEDMYVCAIQPSSNIRCGRYIAIKYRTTEDCDGELFLGSDSLWTGNGDSIGLDYESDGEWHLLIVDLESAASVNNLVLGYLRLDCFTNGTYRTMDIGYIASFDSQEDALAYDAAMGYENIPYESHFLEYASFVKYDYVLNDEESAYIITAIRCKAVQEIDIPAEYDGLPVTGIEVHTFSGVGTDIVSLKIPDSVTNASFGFLSQFPNLERITLPAILAGNIVERNALKDIYCTGTIVEWVYNGGRYFDSTAIHCADGDIMEQWGAAIRMDGSEVLTNYNTMYMTYSQFLSDLPSLEEYGAAYDEIVNTGIDYEEYAQYADAPGGSAEGKLYQEYLAYRSAKSRYQTTKNRRMNDIINMYYLNSSIQEKGKDANDIVQVFTSSYLPVLSEIYGCTIVYEQGQEGNLAAVANFGELPKSLQDRLIPYVEFVKGEFSGNLSETQSLYNQALEAAVETGYITEQEITDRLAQNNE